MGNVFGKGGFVWKNSRFKFKMEDKNSDSKLLDQKLDQKHSKLEKYVLNLMNEQGKWTILEFRKKLVENGNKFNASKSETDYLNFLKKRPRLFNVTTSHVWSLVDSKSINSGERNEFDYSFERILTQYQSSIFHYGL